MDWRSDWPPGAGCWTAKRGARAPFLAFLAAGARNEWLVTGVSDAGSMEIGAAALEYVGLE